jgi:WD40 repeat protein
VELFDAVTGSAVALPVKPVAPIRDLICSLDGRWIATCANSPTVTADPSQTWQVQVWEAATGEAITMPLEILGVRSELLASHSAPKLVFSEDGRWLAVCSQTAVSAPMGEASGFAATMHALEVRRGATFNQTAELRGLVKQCFFAPKSHRLVLLNTAGGTLMIRDLARGENLTLRQPQEHDYLPLEVSQDAQWLLGSAQSGWRVWEVASGQPITPVLDDGRGGFSGVEGNLLAPDGRVVLAGSVAEPQLWPLTADTRPLAAITQEVQLLAARELDASGSMVPLAPHHLINLWQTLRRASPATPGNGTNHIAWWHLHQAGQSEQASQWFAAEFHLNRVLGTSCDGPRTRQRLAHARTQAALEMLNHNP